MGAFNFLQQNRRGTNQNPSFEPFKFGNNLLLMHIHQLPTATPKRHQELTNTNGLTGIIKLSMGSLIGTHTIGISIIHIIF